MNSPSYGVVETLSPLVRRVLAPNPSPFTFTGTGVFIVGSQRLAVIDPGPNTPKHLEALIRAVDSKPVEAILVTHTHSDHSPAARPLAQLTGAPVYAFGPHHLASHLPADAPPLEEDHDLSFQPDVVLKHQQTVSSNEWNFTALHTPGHTSNHLCFALQEEQTLFSGDHVMGWSTTVVVPPDGDMDAYINSLKYLLPRKDALYRPTHGNPIHNPQKYVKKLIEHRLQREKDVINRLKQGDSLVPDVVRVIYADVDKRLHGAAAMSTLAHLLRLQKHGVVAGEGNPLNLKSPWRLLLTPHPL